MDLPPPNDADDANNDHNINDNDEAFPDRHLHRIFGRLRNHRRGRVRWAPAPQAEGPDRLGLADEVQQMEERHEQAEDDLANLGAVIERHDQIVRGLMMGNRARLRIRLNGVPAAGAEAADDFDEDLDDDDDDFEPDEPFDEDIPFGFLRAARVRRAREEREQEQEALFGPGLYALLTREDFACTCALRGSVNSGCHAAIQRCQGSSNEVYYQNRRDRRTPLHEAALRCTCLPVLESIINSVRDGGALLSKVDSAGMTPFMCFLIGMTTRRIEPATLHSMMTLLLGPSPSFIAGMANRDGYTPLHIALTAPESMRPVDLIERLVNLQPSKVLSSSNEAGQTPVHTHCKRPLASVEVLQILLKAAKRANTDAGTERNVMSNDLEMGYNPFHYAAYNGNTELVDHLLTNPIDMDNTLLDEIPIAGVRSRDTAQTALHIVCQHHPHNIELIEILLQAYPQAAAFRDSIKNSTPAHLLCKHPKTHAASIRALIKADPECLGIPDADSYLPLHYACEIGAHVDIITMLLTAYPLAASLQTRKLDTALSLACAANRSPETIQILVRAFPEAVTKANQYGFIPIHSACRGYQPKLAILRSLVQAETDCTKVTTQSGEVAYNLARNNKSASIVILDYLANVTNEVDALARDPIVSAVERQNMLLDNKKGNNTLHTAILRRTPVENIESIAAANSRMICMRNYAGYTPLQLLCKMGEADVTVISVFSQIGGPSVFSVTDEMGNTPLHSAMREDVTVEFLEGLIRAYPEALHMKTIYDDTPLHLACKHRVDPDAIRMLATASSAGLELTLSKGNTGRLSPLLMQNSAGQSPISIAMENYQRLCLSSRQGCLVKGTFEEEHNRAFNLLATLAKILHFGPVERDELGRPLNLLGACVSLHRKDVRLDPAFIRRALFLHPEDALLRDKDGNYPLHVEASIPVEKMMLLEPDRQGCCNGACQKRNGVLRALFEVYPDAACQLNEFGEFPLSLMALSGRQWDATFRLIVQKFPEAIYAVEGLDSALIPLVLKKLFAQCGIDTVYSFMKSMPGL